jgi:hypothetical protein
MSIIHNIMMYHVVVDHDTTLSITSLQISHTLLIPVSKPTIYSETKSGYHIIKGARIQMDVT